MDEDRTLPEWFRQLTPRDQEQVRHARDYATTYTAAGVPGHSQFLLIARLADLLDGHALNVEASE